MALFGTGCPVDERERTWIQDSMAWLRGQFGDAPLTAPVIHRAAGAGATRARPAARRGARDRRPAGCGAAD
jgi:hypothetical protein